MNRAAAAALAAIHLLAGCNPSRPPWADGRMVTEERRGDGEAQDLTRLETRLLAIHNRERAVTGARPLAWDSGLAAAAASYGPALERLGKLAHSPATSRQGQGEKLWMGTGDAYELEDDQVAMSPGHGCERPGDVRT